MPAINIKYTNNTIMTLNTGIIAIGGATGSQRRSFIVSENEN
jgi:hypothetical protein